VVVWMMVGIGAGFGRLSEHAEIDVRSALLVCRQSMMTW